MSKGMTLGAVQDADDNVQEGIALLVKMMTVVNPIVAKNAHLDEALFKQVELPDDHSRKGLKHILEFIGDKVSKLNADLGILHRQIEAAKKEAPNL